jgi:zinc protease
VAKGEAFDPTPKNIDARSRRVTLPNGAKLVLLPKKTRAETVKLALELRLGSTQSLTGQMPVAGLTALALNRGTKKLPYKDFRSTLERLRAQIDVQADGQYVVVNVEAKRPQLAEVLALLGDVLKDPAFDGKEFEVARGERLTRLERVKDEPQAVGPTELQRALSPYPKDHPLYVPGFPERIAATKAVTVEQAKAFHAKFYGAQAASIAVVGDFDDAEVEKTLTAMLGSWTAKEPFVLVKDDFKAVPGNLVTLPTPDKQNAWLGAGMNVDLTDSSPDYPAMALATSMLGGGASSRLFVSLREEKGLSYGAYGFLDIAHETGRSELQASAIYAPQNVDKVETALQAELEKWSTISKQDLEEARSELLNLRQQSRAEDGELVQTLVRNARLGRTMAWEEDLEAKLKALTPEQVSAAVKKYVDPKKMVVVKAGDFKTVVAPK